MGEKLEWRDRQGLPIEIPGFYRLYDDSLVYAYAAGTFAGLDSINTHTIFPSYDYRCVNVPIDPKLFSRRVKPEDVKVLLNDARHSLNVLEKDLTELENSTPKPGP